MKDENEDLKKEIERLKSLGSSDVGKDVRKLRERLLDLEAKNERLSQEVQDEVAQHDATKRKLDRVSAYGYVAVFRQRIRTRQYSDKYCINQPESRQGRNE